MDFKITKLGDKIEAETNLNWYASQGYYKIQVIGLGATEDAAKKQASLMLGQARAALTIALIDQVPSRVPETVDNASGN